MKEENREYAVLVAYIFHDLEVLMAEDEAKELANSRMKEISANMMDRVVGGWGDDDGLEGELPNDGWPSHDDTSLDSDFDAEYDEENDDDEGNYGYGWGYEPGDDGEDFDL